MPEGCRVLLHNDETEKQEAALKSAFPQVEVQACNSFEALPEALAAFRPDAMYSVRFNPAPFPKEAVFGADGPRWLANGGVGTDHLGQWDTARITVTNAAGVASDMMAEYILGGFLHFTLDVPGLQADKAARHWDGARKMRPLKGRTLLIVGLGHTGRAVAARAKAFGMHVIGTRARPREMENVDEVHAASDLAALLPRADFIAVCTPLIAETRGLIGAGEIAAMKPGVILADVSRGGVVDQAALGEALRAGHVGGAAVDVFETEPLPAESPLWGVENLVISPHCSAVHDGWEVASFNLFLENLGRFLEGRPLENVVDPARGY
ncbi:MAG: D-2-hydroxyacid dehydrogenase [Roseovarius sp.]